ncbi:MAG: hypothetical protein WBP10_12295 [Thermoanaerobaculia bacterium]
MSDHLDRATAKLDQWSADTGPSSHNSLNSHPRGFPELAPEALYGLAGEFVSTVEPHSEADPVALLGQFLAFYGSAVGSGPYYPVESDRHHCNLNVALVGETSRARKGVSEGRVRAVFGEADPDWTQGRILSGLSSGEGLIHAVRDPVLRDGQTIDPGEGDKRLLVSEGEFASVLRVLGRDGNTLSAVLRNAWDGKTLRTLTKHSPSQATGAHVSLVVHITREELSRYFTETEAANGFGNRFIWLAVQRSKLLPEGGSLDPGALDGIAEKVRAALEFGRRAGPVARDEQARTAWASVYPKLTESRPGLLGALIARSEAQATRLALIYALLDLSPVVRSNHLHAALALWDYAESSASYIFGDRLGDPVADDIEGALQRAGVEGMTRTQISNTLGRHRTSAQIGHALETLQSLGRAAAEQESTPGRPAERWYYRGCETSELCELREGP